MAEAAAAKLQTGPRVRAAMDFGIGLGSGVASGAAGSLLGGVAAWILLAFGRDYVSLSSVVTRVAIALGVVVAGVVLANLDRLPLAIGAGVLVGGPLGVIFGGVSWAGLAWAVTLAGVAGLAGVALTFTQIPPLTRREFGAYFLSPVAYVVGTVFLFVFGFIQYLALTAPGAPARMVDAMRFVTVFLMPIVSPVLTMRLLAEEKRAGTIEVLMTAPVRDWEVVLAKYLAALAAFGMMLVPTLIHVLSLYLVSERGPASGELIGGYIGIALTAGLFLSLGLLASALARDQIVSGIVGFAFSFGVFLVSLVSDLDASYGWFGEGSFAREFFGFISYFRHFQMFAQGKIETRSIFYFLSLIVFVLFLTVRVVESRKWR